MIFRGWLVGLFVFLSLFVRFKALKNQDSFFMKICMKSIKEISFYFVIGEIQKIVPTFSLHNSKCF